MLGTMKLLYKEGGIPRFYRGLLPALVQVRSQAVMCVPTRCMVASRPKYAAAPPGNWYDLCLNP
jgi:hypothetical protein